MHDRFRLLNRSGRFAARPPDIRPSGERPLLHGFDKATPTGPKGEAQGRAFHRRTRRRVPLPRDPVADPLVGGDLREWCLQLVVVRPIRVECFARRLISIASRGRAARQRVFRDRRRSGSMSAGKDELRQLSNRCISLTDPHLFHTFPTGFRWFLDKGVRVPRPGNRSTGVISAAMMLRRCAIDKPCHVALTSSAGTIAAGDTYSAAAMCDSISASRPSTRRLGGAKLLAVHHSIGIVESYVIATALERVGLVGPQVEYVNRTGTVAMASPNPPHVFPPIEISVGGRSFRWQRRRVVLVGIAFGDLKDVAGWIAQPC